MRQTVKGAAQCLENSGPMLFYLKLTASMILSRLPRWLRVKNLPVMQKTQEMIPGSGRSPGEEKWQLAVVFLPGKAHGQRSLAVHSSPGCKESDTTEQLSSQHTFLLNFWWHDISQWQFYPVISKSDDYRVHLNKQYWDLVRLSSHLQMTTWLFRLQIRFDSENKMLLPKWLHEKFNISCDIQSF